jgi:hypothetical protein
MTVAFWAHLVCSSLRSSTVATGPESTARKVPPAYTSQRRRLDRTVFLVPWYSVREFNPPVLHTFKQHPGYDFCLRGGSSCVQEGKRLLFRPWSLANLSCNYGLMLVLIQPLEMQTYTTQLLDVDP